MKGGSEQEEKEEGEKGAGSLLLVLSLGFGCAFVLSATCSFLGGRGSRLYF